MIVELCMRFGVQVSEITGQQKLVLNLAGGTRSDAEEPSEFSLALAPASFGDVGRQRDRRPSQLGGEPEAFLRGKALSLPVDFQRAAVRLLPDLNVPEVSHGCLEFGYLRLMGKKGELEKFFERHSECISGVISCFDRVVIMGSLPDISYADAMAAHLGAQNIRLFDFPKWAEPLRNEIRTHAELLAAKEQLEIEFIRRNNFRKEDRIKHVVAERGEHPGLVYIFSAMEPCTSFRPWHDKKTHRTSLKARQAKCLHYYFYFIDADLGLCYLRVPTWAPFRLQFYFNAHNWLAGRLTKRGIQFTLLDNAFIELSDSDKAQRISDQFDVKRLHKKLDSYTRQLCPVLNRFRSGVHWSLMQVEYATDLIFKSRDALSALYDPLVRTAIHAVRADNVATFLGRKLHKNFNDELGNDFGTRIQGTRLKHHMGPVSIKMYDKHGLVLRIETTANNVAFFKHRRTVEHRDGTSSKKLAPVRKTIYSLGVMRELMTASNRRYLAFLTQLDVPDSGVRQLDRISRPVRRDNRSHRGFNLFYGDDLDLFVAIARGEHCISGFRNRDLQNLLPRNGGQISRLLKNLRVHGLIKKIGKTYKYYLTRLGRSVLACALRLRQEVLPALASPAANT